MKSESLFLVGGVEEEGDPTSAFYQFPWHTCRPENCLELLLQSYDHSPAVVVTERILPDGDWKDVLTIVGRMRVPPPVIVTDRLADEYLWAEVLNLGGYDVLAKPLDRHEVKRTVTLAFANWESRSSAVQRRRAAGSGGGEAWLSLIA